MRRHLFPLALTLAGVGWAVQVATTNAQTCTLTPSPLFDQVSPVSISFDGALDLRLEDLDNDGDQDLVYFTFRNNPTTIDESFRILENRIRDCAGSPLCERFPEATDKWFEAKDFNDPLEFEGIYEVNFFDVDNDGDRDMVAASLGQDLIFERAGDAFVPSRVLDPAGELSDYRTCGGVPCVGRATTSHYPGDVDRDGDLDLVAAYRDSRTRLYLNDGGGNFSEAQVFPIPPGDVGAAYRGNGNRDVILEDFDGDGDLDAAIARMDFDPTNQPWMSPPPGEKSVQVYFNEGFACDCIDPEDGSTTAPFCHAYELTDQNGDTSDSNTFTLTAADIDHDGDYDLLQPVLNATGGLTKMTRIYLNDGSGHLGKTADHSPNACLGDADDDFGTFGDDPGFNHRSTVASVWDVDHDGDYDVVLGHVTADRVWLNTGSPNGLPVFLLFEEMPSVIAPGNDNTRYMRFGDLDLDGDLDYCETNFGASTSRIFFNQWRDSQ